MARFARFLFALGFAAALLAAATPAHAFRMIQNNTVGRVTAGTPVACNAPGGFAHWNVRNLSWRLNTANQGSGKNSAVQAAMNVWSAVPNTDYNLGLLGTTTAGFVTDGQNSVVWAAGNGCTDNCLALTALVLQNGQVIVESDVTFNNDFTWNTNGVDFDVQAVAAHEFGHTLGIHHTEVSLTNQPTMDTPYFGTGGRTLEADDNAALQCSEARFCLRKLTGSGAYFAGRQIASLNWSCVQGANVDVFRDGVKVMTTPNDGGQTHQQFAPQGTANFWVCTAGSTSWYDSATCTNVVTLSFFAP